MSVLLSDNISELLKFNDALPYDGIEILRLFYIEKRKLSDISNKLKIPITTVRSKKARAEFVIKKLVKNKELINAYKIIYPAKSD